MAKLRVFAWETESAQRKIVATRSKHAALGLLFRPMLGPKSTKDLVETDEEIAVATATAEPGAVFWRPTGKPDGTHYVRLGEKWTPPAPATLRERRLQAAISAIVAAGCEDLRGHLPDRMRRAFKTGSDGQWGPHDVLAQARSWASIVRDGVDDPVKKAAARDAIGALWAVMEVEDEERSETT